MKMLNHRGTVFEKDLGPNTVRTAAGMTAFDPDGTWRKVVNAGLPATGRQPRVTGL